MASIFILMSFIMSKVFRTILASERIPYQILLHL
jgi:hypothetical protein